MKTSFIVSAFVCSAAVLSATTISGSEYVQFSHNNLFLFPAGTVLKAPDKAELPHEILVLTNGTFTVKGGKMRTLQDGDVLSNEGMLIKPDGRVTPVMDHVTLNQGRVVFVKDGEPTEVRDTVRLSDGTTVAADWKITPASGAPRRLMDGEVFQLNGTSVPSRDSITKQNGQVSVQKDGSKLSVPVGRSIMMNDGTKVYGDGTVEASDGSRTVLADKDVLLLPGVVRLPR